MSACSQVAKLPVHQKARHCHHCHHRDHLPRHLRSVHLIQRDPGLHRISHIHNRFPLRLFHGHSGGKVRLLLILNMRPKLLADLSLCLLTAYLFQYLL